MKKAVRVILWICVVLFTMMTFFAVIANPSAEGSFADVFFDKLSSVILLGVPVFGFMAELNLFGLRNKIPLIKSNKISRHILFLFIVFLFSSILGFAVSNFSGKAYREEKRAIYQSAQEEESREQAQKDAEKNAEKEERAQAKNEEKQQEAAEKQQKKEQKQKEDEQKKAQKQQIKEQKQKEKEQKKAQKQQKKEQKRLEKEQKRLEKEKKRLKKDSEAALDQAQTVPTTESFPPDNTAQIPAKFTWTELLKDQDRYLEVLSLIGENYNAGRVNDTLKERLSEDELVLAEEIFRAGNKVPEELNETFAALCRQRGYTILNAADESFYDRVSKGFVIGWDSRTDEPELRFYEIPEGDYTEDKRYLDAERYVAPGCILYTYENGTYKEYAKVLDVRYGAVIDDTCYGFAIKLQFLDPELKDPAFDETQYYRDGESLFSLARQIYGKPYYFVAVNDLNRRPAPNAIDYSGFFKWKSLGSYYGSKSGLDVYMGAGTCKVYQFTIEKTAGTAIMTVRYPNGNLEEKNYWAIVNNKYLFVLDN